MTSYGTEPLPVWAFVGAGVAAVALVLEFLGSILGDAPSTSYPAWLVTVGWPTPLRVAWWAGAAGGAAAAAFGVGHASGRPARLRPVLVASPFLLFAVGVATGASWATWH